MPDKGTGHDMPEMDITAHIKAIETLKCALLTDLAALYESMRKPSRPEERDEPLADMLVTLYLLSRRLGVNFSQLDGLAIQRLRLHALDETRPRAFTAETQALLQYLSGKTS